MKKTHIKTVKNYLKKNNLINIVQMHQANYYDLCMKILNY